MLQHLPVFFPNIHFHPPFHRFSVGMNELCGCLVNAYEYFAHAPANSNHSFEFSPCPSPLSWPPLPDNLTPLPCLLARLLVLAEKHVIMVFPLTIKSISCDAHTTGIHCQKKGILHILMGFRWDLDFI